MPQHPYRREFIQASAAAAGVITAAGLPGAARAASWTIIDTHRLSDGDCMELTGGTASRIDGWSPSKA